MGGGIFENMWDAYSGPFAYSEPAFYDPRGSVYGAVPQERAFHKMGEPKKKQTVRTIPVSDGSAPVSGRPVKREEVSRFKSEDDAATKIQTVFRGYLVRKTKPLRDLRVIKKVKEELKGFEGRMQGSEQRQKLYNEPQERLRWTEGVMALLLRLDSLQGVHPEVRLIRRALTKELIRLQEAIDWMSTESNGHADVISTDDTNLAQEQVEVIDFPAPEGMEFGESDAEEFNAVEQSAGAVNGHESDVEVPMDVETKERPNPVEFMLELADVSSPDTETLSSNAALANVTQENTPSRDVISEPTSREFAPIIPAMNEAEMCEQATHSGRGEVVEEEEAGRSASDNLQSGDARQGTGSECRDQGEGSKNLEGDSMLLEPQLLQAGQPHPPTDGSSDRALLLQVLEENRKLKDAIEKVLQWGKQQNGVIYNLERRIEQLEECQPPSELLHGEESDERRKPANGRRSEKGRKSGKNRFQFGHIDSEDCLSAESDDYFW